MSADARPADPDAARPAVVSSQPSRIAGPFVVLLAVACALSVANLYYAQPLLDTIAGAFDTTSATAGLVVTLSQVGYAVGLALVVPLGDLLDRRRLVPAVLVLTALALAGSAVAPGIGALIALAALVGLGSVAAQLLVPLAAELAGDEQRGAVVGKVMSGLLLGILLARTVSGLIAELAGWRVVYWVATALAGLLALVLARTLPADGARPRLAYGQLLRATARLLVDQPELRRRAALGALGFAAFSAFWTVLAFHLSDPPFELSDGVIGLFGLVGAAGALAAVFAGRLVDRGWTAITTAGFAVAVAASFAVVWVGRDHVWSLVIGILLLDVGAQGLQVTNQSVIYGLAPEARSRITSAYMVCYFIGGGLGSASAGALYSSHGWGGLCVLGGVLGLAATVIAAPALAPSRHPSRR